MLSSIPGLKRLEPESDFEKLLGEARWREHGGEPLKARAVDRDNDLEGIATSIGRNLFDLCRQGDGPSYSPLAVCGKWGAGKTTFVGRILKAAGIEGSFLYFDPWMVGNQRELAECFISELASSIGSSRGVDIGKHASRLARLAAEGLSASGSAIGGLASGLVGGLSGNSGLSDEKSRICTALAAGNECTVVVVDNIDRLAPQQIAMMVRLLGCVVNFPNVLYILPFDRNVVVSALKLAFDVGTQESDDKEKSAFNADLYLDKIVSLRFDLPGFDLSDVARGELEKAGDSHARALAGDEGFLADLGKVASNPRTLIKLVSNYRIALAAGDSLLFEDAPMMSVYLKTEHREFYDVLMANFSAAARLRSAMDSSDSAALSGEMDALESRSRANRDIGAKIQQREESNNISNLFGSGWEGESYDSNAEFLRLYDRVPQDIEPDKYSETVDQASNTRERESRKDDAERDKLQAVRPSVGDDSLASPSRGGSSTLSKKERARLALVLAGRESRAEQRIAKRVKIRPLVYKFGY